MILARKELLEMIKNKELVVEPFDEKIVRENGIDFRIDKSYALYKHDYQRIDVTELENTEHLFSIIEAEDKIEIKPGHFVLLSTIEYIKLPKNVIGFCNLRSTLARYGLAMPPTIVDAGFEGNLTIEIFNSSQNTIVLKPGLRFLHVVFAKTTSDVSYEGSYKGQRGVTLPKGLKKEL